MPHAVTLARVCLKKTLPKTLFLKKNTILTNVQLKQCAIDTTGNTYSNLHECELQWSPSVVDFIRSTAKLSTFEGWDKDRVGQAQTVDF